MAVDLALLADDLLRVLEALRVSFANLPDGALDPADVSRARRLKASIQDVEIAFSSLLDEDGISEDSISNGMTIIAGRLASIYHDNHLMNVAFRTRYIPPPHSDRPIQMDREFNETRLSTADTLFRLLFIVNTSRRGIRVARQDIDELRRIVPEQKLAPLTFKIVNHQIYIDDQSAKLRSNSKEVVGQAGAHLQRKCDELIAQMEGSNVDPKLIQTLRDVRDVLSSEKNNVALGLLNMELGAIAGSLKLELSDSLYAALRVHSLSIGMYVAQFEEWKQFAENASSIALESAQIEILSQAAAVLVSRLAARRSLAEPKVSKLIGYLNELVLNPQDASQRAAYALLLTLENLVISVFRHGADFVEKAASKSVDAGSTAAARLAVTALVGTATSVALGISPVTLAVEGGEWLMQAIEIVFSLPL